MARDNRSARRKLVNAFGCLLPLICMAALAAPAQGAIQTYVSCPGGGGGDGLSRGFYVTNYGGSSIEKVTMDYKKSSAADPAGTYTITLTARAGAYDGPIIGTVTSNLVNPSAAVMTSVDFQFSGTSVVPGSTIAFSQTFTSPGGTGTLYYDYSTVPCAGVTQTNGTTPPLDTVRRPEGVKVTITGQVPLIMTPVLPGPPGPTGQQAAALKKCKHKHGKARKKCKRKANQLPV